MPVYFSTGEHDSQDGCQDKTELCRVEKWAGMLEGDGHKSDFAGLLKVSMLHYRL